LNLREKALRLEPILGYEIEKYEDLLQDLYNDRIRQVADHEFQAGFATNAAIVHVQKAQEEQEKRDMQKEAIKKVQKQREEFTKEVEDFDSVTLQMTQELKQKHERQRHNLLDHHHHADEGPNEG
jgi:hypothetical protein